MNIRKVLVLLAVVCAAAGAVLAQPASAAARRPAPVIFQVKTVLPGAVVHEPGSLEVLVGSSKCMQHVQVFAFSADGQDQAYSQPTGPHFRGTFFAVFIPFSKGNETGRWDISFASGQSCGNPQVWYAWRGAVPFTVRR